MHCNLRPPNAEPVIFRFNWDARAKFEVGWPISCCFYRAALYVSVVVLMAMPSVCLSVAKLLLVFRHRQRLVQSILSDPRHYLPPTQNWLTKQRGFSATAELLVIADTLRYAVTFTFNPPCDLDFWPLTLNILVYRLWHDETLYQIWAKSNNPRRSYGDLNTWPYDLEHVSRVPLCCGIICTKFKHSQHIRSWNVTVFWCWYVL